MPPATVDIKFNGPQLSAYQALADGRTVFLGWGRGVGKSHFLRTVCWLLVAQWDGKKCHPSQPFRGVRIGWLMPSRKQFVDVHATSIMDELGPGGLFGFLGGTINRSTWAIRFPGGSELTPFPAADANSKAARGYRAHFVIVDECDDVSSESYNSVAVPWMSAHWSLRRELLAGTPTRGRHGLWYRMLRDGQVAEALRSGTSPEELGVDPDNADALSSIYSFHATYRDAPETVSSKAVEKARATTPKEIFEREWEANPDAGEGLIFAEFDPNFHVRTPPEAVSFSEYLVGIDHGDVDPGVMLLIGIQGHGQDATAWVLDEWYEPGQLNSVWNERAQAWRFGTLYPDPSRQDRIREWRAMGLRVQDIPAEVKPVRAGITRIADLLHRRQQEHGDDWCRLYISPKCQNTIREFGLYRRKKRVDGTFSEEPEDKNNHAMDALRYAVASRFGRVNGAKHLVSGR